MQPGNGWGDLMATVLIPAHNEEHVIGRCLRSLLGQAEQSEFEVLVLSNGSSDDTVGAAKKAASGLYAGQSVSVIDIPDAGKAAAINHGLGSGSGPDFIVLDADVVVDTGTARQLVRTLGEPGVVAAAPAVDFDFSGVSWVSRSYHRYWSKLPSIAHGLAGRGVYALSAEGLKRLGRLPLIMADDRFIDLSFGVSERRIVPASSIVVPIGNVRGLIDRKARVFHGNNSLGGETIAGFDPDDRPSGGWIDVLRTDRSAAVDLPAYLGVNLAAKIKARRLGQASPMVAWDQAHS